MHYQPTLHAIQLLGVLLSKHPVALREAMRDPMHGRCLAMALLWLCYRFYFDRDLHMREWVGQVRDEGHLAWDSLRVGACIR